MDYVGGSEWSFSGSRFKYRRVDKNEGLVVGKLFKNGLMSYHGGVWSVEGYRESELIQIGQGEWDALRNKILDAARPYSPRIHIIYPEDVNQIKLLRPNDVMLKMHNKMNYFRCQKSGHINNCETLEDTTRCKICNNSNMVQLPIFIKKYQNIYVQDSELKSTDPHSIYINIDSPQVPRDSKVKCLNCGGERNLIVASPYKPIESLTWICEKCGTENNFKKPYQSKNYYFKIDLPYDSLFRGLVARQTNTRFKDQKDDLKRILDVEIKFLKNIYFSNQMEVYDGCYAAISNKKLFFFESADNKKIIYARKFNTKGVVFEFEENMIKESIRLLKENLDTIPNPDAKDKIKVFLNDEQKFKIALLHTFKHMMLFHVPLLVGIEAGKVSGDYEYFNNNTVTLFDNESGGIGVFETLTNDYARFATWIKHAKESVKTCTRDPHCNGACKLCSFIENCGNINQNLNRFLLFPMFKVDFRELDTFR